MPGGRATLGQQRTDGRQHRAASELRHEAAVGPNAPQDLVGGDRRRLLEVEGAHAVHVDVVALL
eukprot:6453044-Lingulodinium_polyedra.AAC.1